jgi:hypothetical protein
MPHLRLEHLVLVHDSAQLRRMRVLQVCYRAPQLPLLQQHNIQRPVKPSNLMGSDMRSVPCHWRPLC